ncbi:MAG: hypothetical protein J0I79_22850 [Mesorhizobium sp.]|uniref:hypothetical protein n=1 Tax=Mesorhizobium sp. TaxID=1871066 RepID=UPI001AC45329|nr:hypothetical protein [Mesorhizobium sp.]MBN9220795.1 hypothetical protein [Mesorhizobium sp.]
MIEIVRRFGICVGIVAIALIGAGPSPATAAPLASGLMLDEPEPAHGWSEALAADGLVLTKKFPARRAGDTPGGALIRFQKPVPPKGDIAAGFDALIAGVPELARDSPLWQSHGITLSGDAITIKEWCCAHRGDFGLSQAVVGIEGRGRRAFATLTRINLGDDAKAEVDATFQRMVRSWRMAPEDAALGTILVPPKDAGGLSGLYTNFTSGMRANGFGGMMFYSENRVTLFDAGGLFSNAIPPARQDLSTYCREKPLACGTYQLKGGGFFSRPNRIAMMKLADLYGIFSTDERNLAASGKDLRIGDDTWKEVAPLKKGTRLSGSWTYSYAAAGSSGGQSGSVAVQRTLGLASDGRFSTSGWAGANVTNENSGVISSKDAPSTTGRYEIEGYNISLDGDDGNVKMLSFFEPQGSDAVLTINGSDYTRQ